MKCHRHKWNTDITWYIDMYKHWCLQGALAVIQYYCKTAFRALTSNVIQGKEVAKLEQCCPGQYVAWTYIPEKQMCMWRLRYYCATPSDKLLRFVRNDMTCYVLTLVFHLENQEYILTNNYKLDLISNPCSGMHRPKIYTVNFDI